MSVLFYHGMQPRRSSLCKVNTMLKIIDSGGLKSNRLLGNNLAQGFNGLDYISVCSREPFYKYWKKEESAFNLFIKNNFCFILSRDINAIKPVYLNYDSFNHYSELIDYLNYYSGQQFTDLFDEWQVKDEIPLDYVIGIGLPFKYLKKIQMLDSQMWEKIRELYLLSELFHWDIVDSSTVSSFYSYEKTKRKVK